MPRYVILRHELPPNDKRGLHWDLMLESGQTLRAWALDQEPLVSCEMTALELPDHRLAYLDYEGPVSQDRGSVTRWDGGEYRLQHEKPGEIRVLLSGTRLNGAVVLKRDSNEAGAPGERHSWRVSFFAEPTNG